MVPVLHRSAVAGNPIEVVGMKKSIIARAPVLAVTLLALMSCERGGVAPEVFPGLVIVTDTLETAVRGRDYTEAVNAQGGDGAYTWDVIAGALPPGLTLMTDDLGEDDALISGIPEAEGTFAFTVRVQSGDGQTATAQLELRVLPKVPVAIETPAVPPALAGSSYNVGLSAYGGDGSFQWVLAEGSLPPGLVLSEGRITGIPTTPDTARFTLEVRSAGFTDRLSYVLPVVPNRTGTYDITVFPIGNIPESMWPHLDSAITQWQAAITGNLPAVTIPTGFFAPGACGGFGTLMNGTTTDDVLIVVKIEPIDGPGRVLGRAGPCGVRGGTRLPFVGVLILDADDLLPLAGNQTATHIISHEIGHVLGFGTIWGELDLLEGAGTNNPRFVGAHAVGEYRALGGTGDVPVENQGGEGTRDSHWRQTVFRNERMTGFSAAPGVFQPLSRVSVASIRDLGYLVNMTAADNYSLTAALEPGGGGAEHWWGDLGYDEVIREPLRVLEPAP
jgi:hypothetical protein